MLKRLKKTHRRDLQQLARKQKMLKRFKRHTGGIFKSYSPEAEYPWKIQETHRRNVQKLAQKQKILKRLKKTHWRNLHKLARKQEMLKRLKKTQFWRHDDVIRQIGNGTLQQACRDPWFEIWILAHRVMVNMTSKSRNSTIFKSWQQSITETCLTWRCMVMKLVSLQLTAASTHLTQICKRKGRSMRWDVS